MILNKDSFREKRGIELIDVFSMIPKGGLVESILHRQTDRQILGLNRILIFIMSVRDCTSFFVE